MIEQELNEALAFHLNDAPPNPADKSPYPLGFSLDLALRTAPLADILKSYDLSVADAKRIFANPAFRQELEVHREAMKTSGYSFKMKAAAQSEAYLDLLWRLAHEDSTPAPVRANIVAQTVKWAALDNPVVASAASPSVVTPELLQQLQSMPDNELEIRILQVISRKTTRPAKEAARLIEHES